MGNDFHVSSAELLRRENEKLKERIEELEAIIYDIKNKRGKINE